MFLGVTIHAQERNERTVSTVIEFVINTDTIIQNENYWDYINRIIPDITENSSDVESVLLIGSASPEGNYNKNIALSNKRADRIYSYISNLVPKNKIIKNNNYDLFLSKTGLDESDYQKLRATYVEVHFKQQNKPIQKIDTVYVTNEKIDTVCITDTVFIETNPVNKEKLVLSLYNDFVSDLLINNNIGLELYFAKMSFFIDGTFNMRNDVNIWHSGLRKYFNWDYNKVFIEIYGRTGYFNLDDKSGIFYGGGFGLGYKFDLGNRWKLYPIVRIGIDRRCYNGYDNNGDISFGVYVSGQTKSTESSTVNRNFSYKVESKYITDYFGPTYIGIVIQRSFYIKK